MAAPPVTIPAQRPLLGIGLLLIGLAIVPVMDAIAKYLSAFYPVFQITWGRYFFHFLVMAPWILSVYGPKGFRPKRLWLQLLRAGFMLTASLSFFGALSALPMADAIAILFVSPLLVTGMAPFLLRERVGPRRLIAVLAGFIGALIIIRPAGDAVGWPALLALLSAALYSGYAICTRKLAGAAPPLVTLLFTASVGAIVLTIIMPFVWVPPSAQHWPLFIALGLISALGHFFLIKAFEVAEAPLLAPFHYSELLTATLIGYFVFGDFPDAWTWVGAAIVAAAGLYVTWREYRLARPAAAA